MPYLILLAILGAGLVSWAWIRGFDHKNKKPSDSNHIHFNTEDKWDDNKVDSEGHF